jgi:hypothetical protein
MIGEPLSPGSARRRSFLNGFLGTRAATLLVSGLYPVVTGDSPMDTYGCTAHLLRDLHAPGLRRAVPKRPPAHRCACENGHYDPA